MCFIENHFLRQDCLYTYLPDVIMMGFKKEDRNPRNYDMNDKYIFQTYITTSTTSNNNNL